MCESDPVRVILENAAVRAAAVPALAKFAARLPSLRPSIRVLIKRSLLDEDDEVTIRLSIALSRFGSCKKGETSVFWQKESTTTR